MQPFRHDCWCTLKQKDLGATPSDDYTSKHTPTWLTCVGICVQEASLQKLDEVTIEQGGTQLSHIPRIALTQLLA